MSHPGPHALAAPGGRRWQAPPPNPRARLARREARPADRAGAGLHWPRTLAAKGAAPLRRQHLRHRPHEAQAPTLHLIVLDVSGSMRRGRRLALAKGCAAQVIEQAARDGEHVALLSVGGQGLNLLLPPGPARRAGVSRVRPLGGGGGTPLRAGLAEAERLLRAAHGRHGGRSCLWLLTDGHTLEAPAAPRAPDHLVIVDLDDPLHPIGRCAAWAHHWGAELRRPRASAPTEHLA